MRVMIVLSALVVGFSTPAVGQMTLYSFTTTGEYLSQCDIASPPSDCADAVAHVEEVVDDSSKPNDTCDGGPDAMLKLRNDVELMAWLGERVKRTVAWLKLHPEYNDKSYGDGVWAGLKGSYCG
jgi:hypothetical protein